MEKQTFLVYTQRGHKLRFFKGGKPQFVTVGIIYAPRKPTDLTRTPLAVIRQNKPELLDAERSLNKRQRIH